MIEESFVSVLRNQIRKDMNNYADDLASGACQNFDQYQKLCGVIQGLAIAERYLLDLAERMEKENDE